MADFPINPFDKLTPPANFPVLAQGYIQPATPDDIAMDDTGVTGPNLHRRIDMDNCEVMPQEVQPDQYDIFVAGKNSYRSTIHTVHDEDSTTSEVP